MRVLLVGFFSRTYMPYIEKYENQLKKNKIEYDLIEFDRDTTGKPLVSNNSYIFRHKTSTNKIQMLYLSFKYKLFINKVMKKNNYDKIIVLTTMPGLLIYCKLMKKYRGKYIFDYRDYTYEKYGFYRKYVDNIIGNSYCTLMSSKGYMTYFNNKDKIIITHNISNIDDCFKKAEDLKSKRNLNIGFLGYVRYFDVNSRLIEAFKNDKNISLSYIGVQFADCDLRGYCSNNNIKNVSFVDKYENSQKAKFYKNIDIINSIYSLDSAEVKPAIPNRLYDAALFKRPIIVAKGTYLEELVKKYKIGFSIDIFSENIQERLNDYLKKFDSKEFQKNCDKFLKDVMNDENKCKEYVKNFLS